MILTTSNKNKFNEFKKFIKFLKLNKLKIKLGKDIKEVDGNIQEVAIYKALDSGKNTIIEDSVLFINGKPIVDIRYKLNQLLNTNLQQKNTIKLTWVVSLAYNNGEEIIIYKGMVNGILVKPESKKEFEESFGFDSVFLPDGSDITLSQLDKINQKDLFNARLLALINLKKNKVDKKIFIKDIPKWEGKFQNEPSL